jgi:hypothetical protein
MRLSVAKAAAKDGKPLVLPKMKTESSEQQVDTGRAERLDCSSLVPASPAVTVVCDDRLPATPAHTPVPSSGASTPATPQNQLQQQQSQIQVHVQSQATSQPQNCHVVLHSPPPQLAVNGFNGVRAFPTTNNVAHYVPQPTTVDSTSPSMPLNACDLNVEFVQQGMSHGGVNYCHGIVVTRQLGNA